MLSSPMEEDAPLEPTIRYGSSGGSSILPASLPMQDWNKHTLCNKDNRKALESLSQKNSQKR